MHFTSVSRTLLTIGQVMGRPPTAPGEGEPRALQAWDVATAKRLHSAAFDIPSLERIPSNFREVEGP